MLTKFPNANKIPLIKQASQPLQREESKVGQKRVRDEALEEKKEIIVVQSEPTKRQRVDEQQVVSEPKNPEDIIVAQSKDVVPTDTSVVVGMTLTS